MVFTKALYLTFESERQGLFGLKVLYIRHGVAVNGAARFTAHPERGREIQLYGRVIGCVWSELDVLKNLALLTPWSFAVRTPVKMMHKCPRQREL